VGDINMASEECCIGRGLSAVRHKKGFVSYTFYKIRSLKDDFDSFEQQGTVFGSIGKDDFNGIDTIIPDKKVVQKFDTIAKPLDDKIFANSIQIRTLSRLRDALLPKIMSGEVRVNV
jgi:type I restriction enzyme S subunit